MRPHRFLILMRLLPGLMLICAGILPVAHTGVASRSCTPPPLSPDLVTVDGLYVLPDDGRAPLLNEISRAICTIDISSYLISDDEIIAALGRAEARGVEVRLIYEDEPYGGFGQIDDIEHLERLGVETQPGPSAFTYSHAKYLVIDKRVAIITNQNITTASFEENREFGILTTRPEDVAALASIFTLDWTGTGTPTPADRMIVSPYHHARHTFVALINSARDHIRLYVEVIRDDRVIAALSRAARRDVNVQIVTNEPDEERDPAIYRELVSSGIDLRISNHLYIHAKTLMIDTSSVVIGSHNPTATSLDDNREVSLVVRDPIAVARAVAVFSRDRAQSMPWSPMPEATPSGYTPLDMSGLYGYRVRTVPGGLARVSR